MRLRKSFPPDNSIHLSWFPFFLCSWPNIFLVSASVRAVFLTRVPGLLWKAQHILFSPWGCLMAMRTCGSGNTFILNQCSNQEAPAFIVVCSSVLTILFKASDQQWYHFPGTIKIFMCCIIFSVFEMAPEMGLGRWIQILMYCELLCNRSDIFAFCISTLIKKLQRGHMADAGGLRITLWSAKSKHDLELSWGRHHSA